MKLGFVKRKNHSPTLSRCGCLQALWDTEEDTSPPPNGRANLHPPLQQLLGVQC